MALPQAEQTVVGVQVNLTKLREDVERAAERLRNSKKRLEKAIADDNTELTETSQDMVKFSQSSFEQASKRFTDAGGAPSQIPDTNVHHPPVAFPPDDDDEMFVPIGIQASAGLGGRGNYFCSLCRVDLSLDGREPQQMWIRHVITFEHQRAVKQQFGPSGSKQFLCRVCSVVLGGNHKVLHLNSAKHRGQLKAGEIANVRGVLPSTCTATAPPTTIESNGSATNPSVTSSTPLAVLHTSSTQVVTPGSAQPATVVPSPQITAVSAATTIASENNSASGGRTNNPVSSAPREPWTVLASFLSRPASYVSVLKEQPLTEILSWTPEQQDKAFAPIQKRFAVLKACLHEEDLTEHFLYLSDCAALSRALAEHLVHVLDDSVCKKYLEDYVDADRSGGTLLLPLLEQLFTTTGKGKESTLPGWTATQELRQAVKDVLKFLQPSHIRAFLRQHKDFSPVKFTCDLVELEDSSNSDDIMSLAEVVTSTFALQNVEGSEEDTFRLQALPGDSPASTDQKTEKEREEEQKNQEQGTASASFLAAVPPTSTAVQIDSSEEEKSRQQWYYTRCLDHVRPEERGAMEEIRKAVKALLASQGAKYAEKDHITSTVMAMKKAGIGGGGVYSKLLDLAFDEGVGFLAEFLHVEDKSEAVLAYFLGSQIPGVTDLPQRVILALSCANRDTHAAGRRALWRVWCQFSRFIHDSKQSIPIDASGLQRAVPRTLLLQSLNTNFPNTFGSKISPQGKVPARFTVDETYQRAIHPEKGFLCELQCKPQGPNQQSVPVLAVVLRTDSVTVPGSTTAPPRAGMSLGETTLSSSTQHGQASTQQLQEQQEEQSKKRSSGTKDPEVFSSEHFFSKTLLTSVESTVAHAAMVEIRKALERVGPVPLKSRVVDALLLAANKIFQDKEARQAYLDRACDPQTGFVGTLRTADNVFLYLRGAESTLLEHIQRCVEANFSGPTDGPDRELLAVLLEFAFNLQNRMPLLRKSYLLSEFGRLLRTRNINRPLSHLGRALSAASDPETGFLRRVSPSPPRKESDDDDCYYRLVSNQEPKDGPPSDPAVPTVVQVALSKAAGTSPADREAIRHVWKSFEKLVVAAEGEGKGSRGVAHQKLVEYTASHYKSTFGITQYRRVAFDRATHSEVGFLQSVNDPVKAGVKWLLLKGVDPNSLKLELKTDAFAVAETKQSSSTAAPDGGAALARITAVATAHPSAPPPTATTTVSTATAITERPQGQDAILRKNVFDMMSDKKKNGVFSLTKQSLHYELLQHNFTVFQDERVRESAIVAALDAHTGFLEAKPLGEAGSKSVGVPRLEYGFKDSLLTEEERNAFKPRPSTKQHNSAAVPNESAAKVSCQLCNQLGHTAKECTSMQKQGGGFKPLVPTQPPTSTMSVTSVAGKPTGTSPKSFPKPNPSPVPPPQPSFAVEEKHLEVVRVVFDAVSREVNSSKVLYAQLLIRLRLKDPSLFADIKKQRQVIELATGSGPRAFLSVITDDDGVKKVEKKQISQQDNAAPPPPPTTTEMSVTMVGSSNRGTLASRRPVVAPPAPLALAALLPPRNQIREKKGNATGPSPMFAAADEEEQRTTATSHAPPQATGTGGWGSVVSPAALTGKGQQQTGGKGATGMRDYPHRSPSLSSTASSSDAGTRKEQDRHGEGRRQKRDTGVNSTGSGGRVPAVQPPAAQPPKSSPGNLQVKPVILAGEQYEELQPVRHRSSSFEGSVEPFRPKRTDSPSVSSRSGDEDDDSSSRSPVSRKRGRSVSRAHRRGRSRDRSRSRSRSVRRKARRRHRHRSKEKKKTEAKKKKRDDRKRTRSTRSRSRSHSHGRERRERSRGRKRRERSRSPSRSRRYKRH